MRIGTIVRDADGFIGIVTEPGDGVMVGYYDGRGEPLQKMWPASSLIELYPAPDFDIGSVVTVLEDIDHNNGTIIRKGAQLEVVERSRADAPIHCTYNLGDEVAFHVFADPTALSR